MPRAASIFFVLGLVGMVLGIYSIAGLSLDIGKMLLLVFVVSSILSSSSLKNGFHNIPPKN